jgi:hypothetical protein
MAWAHFEKDRRQNPKEGFEHERKRKNAPEGDQDQDGNNRLGKMSHGRKAMERN